MNLEKARHIKQLSLCDRLFFLFGGIFRAGENSLFFASQGYQSLSICKIVEANKAIPIDILKGNIQVLINTVVTKWISNKLGEKSFLSTTEPFIEFLDRVSERVYNYIKEVRRKGR